MQQFENIDLINQILKSVIEIISRRTSGAYAIVVTGNAIKKLQGKYRFFNYIEVKSELYSEFTDIIDIKVDVNNVDLREIGGAIKEFMEKLSSSMGKEAGYYFIKEIKEDLPHGYESILASLGVDFDIMQLAYITERKRASIIRIENSDTVKFVIRAIYNVLESDLGRNRAFSTINELISRFKVKYEILKYVTINDTRHLQGTDNVVVSPIVDSMKSETLGNTLQKIIQEVSISQKEKGGSIFIEKLKNYLNADQILKLEEIGVKFHVIHLRQDLVVKHMLKALFEVLSDASTKSYAVLTIDSALKKTNQKYKDVKYIKIDSTKYSEGINAVHISSEIESVRPSELGRMIQKIIEKVAKCLGGEAGQQFVENFKKRLGKTYVLRLEEMGINFHIIELQKNLLW